MGGCAGRDAAGRADLALRGVDNEDGSWVAAPVDLCLGAGLSFGALYSMFISVCHRDDIAGGVWVCVFIHPNCNEEQGCKHTDFHCFGGNRLCCGRQGMFVICCVVRNVRIYCQAAMAEWGDVFGGGPGYFIH
jgi:hypothetical protein